jgi:large subunit ribosomal protein L25
MSETVLIANTGRETGSASARRLRANDEIPAVLYGHGMTPLHISVARRDLRTALSGSAGLNTVLDLTVDGTAYPAIIKDLQRHPVKRNVSHVDFIQINLSEEITVNIPIRLEGEATAVAAEGGLVDPAMDTLEVVTTPRNIPDEIVIDISRMDMDTVIHLADIELPDGVTATADDDVALVTVLFIRAEELESDAEPDEVEEGEEGEEGEGAEGEEREDGENADAAEGDRGGGGGGGGGKDASDSE